MFRSESGRLVMGRKLSSDSTLSQYRQKTIRPSVEDCWAIIIRQANCSSKETGYWLWRFKSWLKWVKDEPPPSRWLDQACVRQRPGQWLTVPGSARPQHCRHQSSVVPWSEQLVHSTPTPGHELAGRTGNNVYNWKSFILTQSSVGLLPSSKPFSVRFCFYPQ